MEKVEAQKARRSALVYIILTIALVLLIFFYGIGLLSNFADIVSGFLGSNSPVAITDNTPPAPPRLDDLDEFTNNDEIEIEGVSEAGSLVTISVNGIQKETVATKEGSFRLSFDLVGGENEIYATAKDTAGNTSTSSEVEIVTLDKKLPEIEIEMPDEGQNFKGSEKQIEVKGSVSEAVDMEISGKSVYVSSDLEFSTRVDLSEGENVITIKAEDRAGNTNEAEIKVNYQP